MSFTSEIKNETSMLCLTQSEKIAELSAFIRSNGKIFDNYIELYTENIKIAKRMFSFIKDLYNINCEIENRSNQLFTKKNIYYVYIKEKKKMILEDLSILDQKGEYLETVSQYIVGSLDEIKAYIRGSFYARGSINDPKTSQYHLEFLYDNKFEAVFIQRLLNEFELNAKILMREKKYMVYIKDSDDISDFLKLIGASQGVMYYENIRALKEQKNITNRLNNCEQANTDKILMSSNEQIKDINLIVEKLGEEFLDEKLLEAANYRCKYPESSLLELSEIMSMETGKNITKSGLNHRFRKIKEIASKLRDSDK